MGEEREGEQRGGGERGERQGPERERLGVCLVGVSTKKQVRGLEESDDTL